MLDSVADLLDGWLLRHMVEQVIGVVERDVVFQFDPLPVLAAGLDGQQGVILDPAHPHRHRRRFGDIGLADPTAPLAPGPPSRLGHQEPAFDLDTERHVNRPIGLDVGGILTPPPPADNPKVCMPNPI